MKQVAVGIITRQNSAGEAEYLLVNSRKYHGKFTGYFYPAGGHVEAGETPEEALVREVHEELNLAASNLHLVAVTPSDVADQETYWYTCSVSGSMAIDDELQDAHYFTREEIEHGKV